MQFKFDTKPTYTIVTPLADVLDDNLTGALLATLQQTPDEKATNYIIDLQNCVKADNTSRGELLRLHEWCYEHKSSLVITGVLPATKEALVDDTGEDTALNIAPSMEEAIDIISMEILERDLMAEDEEWSDEI